MTKGEQRILVHGVAAGTIMGLAIGLMVGLFIAVKPEQFAGRNIALGVSFGVALVVPCGLMIMGVMRAKS